MTTTEPRIIVRRQRASVDGDLGLWEVWVPTRNDGVHIYPSLPSLQAAHGLAMAVLDLCRDTYAWQRYGRHERIDRLAVRIGTANYAELGRVPATVSA